MLAAVLSIVVGLLGLIVGGELLVRGASGLAAAARISPLVIGLTVVAFGTSSPELAVSFQAALAGRAEIALGNVIGSNIFNVLFILGISALVLPLVVSSQLVRLDVPLMIGASILVFLLALDGQIGRVDGIVLFVVLLVYTSWLIIQSRKEQGKQASASNTPASAPAPSASEARSARHRLAFQIALVLVGLVLLAWGADWLVHGAVEIATGLGMSPLIIGLTVVAAGTSLPEVSASVLASVRGERDIAVGNVVGSNLFNLLAVLGLSAASAVEGIPVSNAVLRFDFPVMIAVAVACLPIFFTGHLIARWEGGLFLAYYVAYTAYLVLAETNIAVSRTYGAVLLGFVIPLTVVTLAIAVWRTLRAR